MSRKWKGIVLAGGLGTRLYPVTKVISKHVIPVYNKPMIHYSLSTLLLASIRDIAIISDIENINLYKKMFGSGKDLGINLSYLIQEKPRGIAESFLIAEDFIGKDNIALILGDNIFYGASLRKKLLYAKKSKKNAVVFSYQVQNPSSFGVVEYNKNNQPISIIEKPKKPKLSHAVTGLYFYKNNVVRNSKKIKLSSRNQYEITDLNNIYLKNQDLEVVKLGRGFAWLDMGTHDSLLDASNFIRTIERRQGTKISCLEEYSYLNKWINNKDLLRIAKSHSDNEMSNYLLSLSKEAIFWK